jgi:hypothetical protein
MENYMKTFKKSLPIIMLIVLLLSGCKSTPNNDIVLKKNNAWMSKINEYKKTSYTNELPINNDKLSFEIKSDGYVINLDAKYHIPNVSNYPVVQVCPKKMTQNQLDTAIKLLFDGKPLYEARQTLTKKEIKDYLIVLKQRLALCDQENSPIDEPKESIENAIKQFEIKYLTAPTEVEEELIETNLNIYSKDNISIYGETKIDGMEKSWISFTSSEQNNKIFFGTSYDTYSSISNYDKDLEKYEKLINVNKDEALNISRSFLESMNITGMDNYKITPVACLGNFDENTLKEALISSPKAYRIDFYRVYKDIPITVDNSWICKKEFSNHYSRPYPYEGITFLINETGIIELKAFGLLETQDEFCENSPLLDMDSIIDISKKYLPIKCQEFSRDNITDYNVNITDIYLGFMRVKINEQEYMLIPVWDFYGYANITYVNPETNLKESYTNNNYNTSSILTINAIDGSIINREYGY